MNRQQLEDFVLNELNPEEAGCFNFCIYWNPHHAAYKELFKQGKYKQCKDYILKHRSHIKLENVPANHKATAQQYIKSVVQLRGVKTSSVRLSE